MFKVFLRLSLVNFVDDSFTFHQGLFSATYSLKTFVVNVTLFLVLPWTRMKKHSSVFRLDTVQWKIELILFED